VAEKRDLEARLGRSRMMNVVLGVVTIFLLVIVLAQTMGNSESDSNAGKQSGDATPSGNTQTVAPTGDTSGKDVQPSEGSGAQTASHIRGDASDPMAIGDPNAPVVLSEWTDYRCPFCSLFANQTLPTLIEEYVDSGQLRIEFNDVAFFGQESFDAAVAGRAAAQQGKYMEYMTALFAAAPDSGHPDMPREKLVGFAKEAGVPDLAAFEAALDSSELQNAVQASQDAATQGGLSSVPYFVVGDKAVAGAQPIDVFRELITSAQGD
jgi:Protein-disulfide isomerase